MPNQECLGDIDVGDGVISIPDDYIEALVDIAVNCGSLIQQDKISIVDSRTIPQNCKLLADEFSTLHAETSWQQEDYIEMIDEFSTRRLMEIYPL